MTDDRTEWTDARAERLLPLTEATYCILAALATPQHGYGIMRCVVEASGGFVQIGPGTLYGALAKLQGLGLIERAGEDRQAAGPHEERRKTYALTPLGRDVVRLESERLERMARIGRAAMRVLEGSK